MALQQKLTEEDLALLEIFEDPIWLGEFLRSTNDGEIDPSLQPVKKWKYRDYQRQFLSDQTEFILYTGGRAIGKCQISGSKIYTDKGYKTIRELIQQNTFAVYTLTPEMQLEQRRALLSYDGQKEAYTIVTESGHIVVCTGNHPILTPNGYKITELLTTNDRVAVSTHLPYFSNKSAYRWHELRMLGYVYLLPYFKPERYYVPKTKKVAAELKYICEQFGMRWRVNSQGHIIMPKQAGPFKHPVKSLLLELDLYHNLHVNGGLRIIPNEIKEERLENIQVFLEAVLAQFADISLTGFSLKLLSRAISEDFQELLLRFGIETRIERKGTDHFILSSLDYRAVYRLLTKFNIPGIAVGQIRLPPETDDATEFMRFEKIKDVYVSHKKTDTYALYVYDTMNYISSNIFVHNSVVLEDKIVYDVVNQNIQFPVTKEALLVTPNQAQMTPILGKLVSRFSSGKLLKDFLKNKVNRSEGTMRFPVYSREHIFHFRIAGSTGDRNMVGLHIPRITGDEMQLFPLSAWTQLGPAYNQ